MSDNEQHETEAQGKQTKTAVKTWRERLKDYSEFKKESERQTSEPSSPHGTDTEAGEA